MKNTLEVFQSTRFETKLYVMHSTLTVIFLINFV